jgi:hypothetical protein
MQRITIKCKTLGAVAHYADVIFVVENASGALFVNLCHDGGRREEAAFPAGEWLTYDIKDESNDE